MKYIRFVFVVVILLWINSGEYIIASTRKKIQLNGIVTDLQGRPVGGAGITVGKEKGEVATNTSGAFTVYTFPDATLLVSSIGYETIEIPVNGRKEVTIQLKESLTELPEVTVSSTLKKLMKITFDPTELELIKDRFFLKTRYRVPSDLFHPDSRLIIQPVITDKSTNVSVSLRPVVFDGKVYDILIKRGNVCGDPAERDHYSPYAVVVDKFSADNLIAYSDSLSVENVSNDYEAEVFIKIGTFCDAAYHDSIVIARGVVYPMRFLDYNLVAMALGNEYTPAQEIQSFDEKGEIKLSFLAGDAAIYENVGRNTSELKKMRDALGEIDRNTTKKLKFFRIKGYTSPEGTYEYNQKLAKQRMKNAIEKMTLNLSAETLNNTKLEDEALVESWLTVYNQMQNDTVPEASELGDLIKRARNSHDEISWGAKRLKSYTMINNQYLAPLRRVEYNYNYTEFRTLKNEEIKALYDADPKKLTANEFWRYITMQTGLTDERREFLYRQALSVHPGLLVAANNLAVLKIEQNQADTTILQSFLTADAPLPVWVNQAVAYLQLREFATADQIASRLPDKEECRMTKALAAALSGKYEEAYPVIAAKGGINKAVMLLSMKRNKEAYDVLKELPDRTANAEYLRAITANRLNLINEALIHLNMAFELNPSLREVAEKDGDVIDLVDIK